MIYDPHGHVVLEHLSQTLKSLAASQVLLYVHLGYQFYQIIKKCRGAN